MGSTGLTESFIRAIGGAAKAPEAGGSEGASLAGIGRTLDPGTFAGVPALDPGRLGLGVLPPDLIFLETKATLIREIQTSRRLTRTRKAAGPV